MKSLLIATAVIELEAGLALLLSPSLAISLLFDSTLDSPAALMVARLGGAGLLTLGVACGLARNDAQSRAAAGLVAAMLLYNIAAAAILAFARIGLGLHGVLRWPGVLLHTALAVWCVACLRSKRAHPTAAQTNVLSPAQGYDEMTQ